MYISVYGCTDSLAVNYNALATDEDDSCEYPISGCIDLLSCNYDSLANTDNGLYLSRRRL